MPIATCKDADNKLLHLATGICDKENADSHSWFYRTMKENVDMEGIINSEKTTLSTDRHQSHAPAISTYASACVWRWCLRHVISTLPQAVGLVNSWVFHAARAPSRAKFMDMMDREVKPKKPIAYDALMKIDPARWTHYGGPSDTVIGDQTTSIPVEQNMSMVGAEARKLPPYGLAVAILDKTASMMAERADLGKGITQRFTPFAAADFEGQRNKCSTLQANPTGNGNFTVRQTGSNYGNRVRLEFGPDGALTRMTCTCGFTARFKIPCCDVIAVGRSLVKAGEVMEAIDSAYRLDTYRAAYDDSRFEVQLPVPEQLTRDNTFLPPRWVEGQASRRPGSKGPSRTERIPSKGKKAASSSFNIRLADTSGMRQGAFGSTQGAPALSQGASALSQGTSAMWQGAPAMWQGAPAMWQGAWQGAWQGPPAMRQGPPAVWQGARALSQGAPAPSHGAPAPSQGGT